MTALDGLRFGPIALQVEGEALHPLLDAWRSPVPTEARRVVVSRAAALAPDTCPATARVDFALTTHPDHDALTLRGDPAAHTPWLAAFCEIVARDATAHGALLLHAGAVTVAGGVALLLAPPGVGKTTAVRGAGPRAFASNAVLVQPSGGAGGYTVSAVPFAGDPAPELDSPLTRPLAALAFVHRSPVASVEWIPGSLATIRLMPHVTRPRGADPHARARVELAMSLSLRVRGLSLGLPLGPGYLDSLDHALQSITGNLV